MSSNQKIIVPPESDSTRLDVFLSNYLKTSRNQVQKIIEKKQVKINKKYPKKTGDKVKPNDIIIITEEKKPTIAQKKATLKKEKKFKLSIITDAPDYLVINKPAGQLTHPTLAGETNTLVNNILEKYPEIKGVGEDEIRPGIVHRLDKDASGLLVIAKNNKSFKNLKKQFKDRTVNKNYKVLVFGKIDTMVDVIDLPIIRSRKQEKMTAIPKTVKGIETDKGKQSITEFEIEKNFINFTLLNIKLLTGRMHQIRVHMLSYNHPVVGDKLYYQKKNLRTNHPEINRLFLHSYKLEFKDLKKEQQSFVIKLPNELEKFLKNIK